MRGFTLIEILVTITLMSFVFVVGLAQYNDFNRGQIVKQAAATLKNNLRLIQDKALAGEKDCVVCQGVDGTCGNADDLPLDSWCMNFNATDYSFYGQCGGSPFSVNAITLSDNVSLSADDNPICFKPLTGGTSKDGTLTLTLSAYGQNSVVTVSERGEVE